MSGPKVVRVVTREEVEAICRRETALVQAAADELRRAHRRHGRLGEGTERAIANSSKRLADLSEAGRYLDLQKQAPQLAAFFKSETERVVREAVAVAEIARSRRRRIADAARSVCAALTAAGRPIPDALRDVAAKASVVAEQELETLQAAVDAGFRALVPACRSGDENVGVEAQSLAARLGAEQARDTLAEWLARHKAVPSPTDARLDAALAAVEALGDPELAAAYAARAAALENFAVERRALMVDSLLLDASRDAKRLREEAALRVRLHEAASGLDALGTHAAVSLSKQLREASVGDSAREAERLLAEAAIVVERETAAIAAAASRRAVLSAFAALGYEVREGMATVWARDGRLVFRKPGTSDYGVELGAPGDASRMQVRLVGSNNPSAPRNAVRDRDQEVSWCSDFGRLRDVLHASGGDITIDRAVEAGAQPVKTVVFAGTGDEGSREIKSSPQIRTLR